MFVFVFEGALWPLTFNGDRFELFALLPRRKPRTVQYSRLIAVVCGLSARTSGINLTGGGYSDLLAVRAAGMDFVSGRTTCPVVRWAACGGSFRFRLSLTGEGAHPIKGRGFSS